MGAAIYPENGSDPAALVRSADQAMLASTGIDPTLLEFEITESSLMRNPAMTASLLKRFRSYGLQFVD